MYSLSTKPFLKDKYLSLRLFFKKTYKLIFSRFSFLFSFKTKIKLKLISRPHYAYCIFNACQLASKLGLKSISVIEFGVASGNGLVCIEEIAAELERLFDMKIEIYGFDTAQGLPKPNDYRDLPYHWKEGFFKMDYEKLTKKLSKTKLIIGNLKDTSNTFLEKYSPAPIGAIFHDLDFYSSTKISLNLFKENNKFFLPRIFNYFDDIVGTEIELFNDYTGERLAINEFNNENKDIKISPCYNLISQNNILTWHYQIFITHIFKHDLYNSFISKENQQIIRDYTNY